MYKHDHIRKHYYFKLYIHQDVNFNENTSIASFLKVLEH